jgi:hypothetical protein
VCDQGLAKLADPVHVGREANPQVPQPAPHAMNQHPSPQPNFLDLLDTPGTRMPTLELPPVPFARGAAQPFSMPAAPAAPAPMTPAEPMPSGTSVQELIDSLRLDSPLTITDPEQQLPHGEFHAAVQERRNRVERRRAPRETGERRAFASPNMAAPATGPEDPRPVAPPAPAAPALPMPLDTRMPELPEAGELQPARPYELPSRGVASETIRSSRASTAVQPTTAPFVPQAATPVPMWEPQAEVALGHAFFPPSNSDVIDDIFGTPSATGRLEPWIPAELPLAGPSGPSIAPGAGLDPTVASIAAAPSAWFGGSVQVDDAMLVWNAPSSTAPLAPAVAAAIQPMSAAPAAAGTAIATSALVPAAPTAALAGAAGTAAAGSSGSLLRLLAWIALPAAAGIGLAAAISHFLL